MTLEQYAYLAEIVGVIIVVITLIYLAVQVRQGTESLRSDSRQAAMNIDQNAIYKFIEHPDLGRSHSGNDDATFEEKTRLQFWIVSQMRVREYEWLQYRSGALDEVTWLSYRDVILFVLGTDRSRALWRLCARYFNTDFVEMVDSMVSDVPVIDFWHDLDAVA